MIGHECAGIIEEVGSEVKNLVPGDRVALEPGISCWRCEQCKQGSYNLCPQMKFFATPPVHGSLANQVCISIPFILLHKYNHKKQRKLFCICITGFAAKLN